VVLQKSFVLTFLGAVHLRSGRRRYRRVMMDGGGGCGGCTMMLVVVGRAPRGTCCRRPAGAAADACGPSAAAGRRDAVPRIGPTPRVGRRRRCRKKSEAVVRVGHGLAGQLGRDVAKNAIYRRYLRHSNKLVSVKPFCKAPLVMVIQGGANRRE